MSFFEIAAIVIVLTAVFSLINWRYIKLPTTVGVMLMTMAASLAIISIGKIEPAFRDAAARFVGQIDFNRTVLHGMLAFLLFAGAMHLDVRELKRQWWPVTALSIFGTAISTLAVAAAIHGALHVMGMEMGWIGCLLFGALISPTDPVAVLGILKSANPPKSLATQMAGESLFNDGIGVVFFLTILQASAEGKSPGAGHVIGLLAREAGGGVVLGLICGLPAFAVLRRVDQYQVEVLVTLALAMGVYALGDRLKVSAPIAVIVAGLCVGGREGALAKASREDVDGVWKLIDEVLNALLFMLIGLQVLVMPFEMSYWAAGAAAIGIVLLVRWASVAGIVVTTGGRRRYCRGTVAVLWWGGLRGGLSIAMVLALVPSPQRDLILAMTYMVVVFSVAVQGLTFGRVVRRNCDTAEGI